MFKSRLISIYFAGYMGKKTLVVLFSAIFIMCFLALLNTGVVFKKPQEHVQTSTYIYYYWEQSVFTLGIINAVIVTFILALDVGQLSPLDCHFASFIPRYKIIFSRILTGLLILFIVLIFEVSLHYLVAAVVFEDYIFSYYDLKLIVFLFLQISELFLLGKVILSFFNNYLVIFLIFLLNLLILNLSTVIDLSLLIPIVKVEYDEFKLNFDFYPYLGLCLLFLLIIIGKYQKKDIN